MFNFNSVEELKAFLTENKDTNEDVKGILGELTTKEEINIDKVKSYLETDGQGKSFLDSVRDTHLTKGLDTWKKNNLEKIVQERMKEINPDLSPDALKIKELENKFEAAQREINTERLKIKALDYARSKELPHEFVDKFLGEDEESTMKNLENFETTWKTVLKNSVEARMAGSRPPHITKDGNSLTLDDVEKMTEEEINANWNEIQKLQN